MTAAWARTRSGSLQAEDREQDTVKQASSLHAVAFGRKTRAGLVTAARARTRSGGLQVGYWDWIL